MARQRNYALSQQGRSDSLRPLADGVVSVEIDEEEPPHVATVLSLRRAAAWLTSPAGIVLALLVLQSTSVVLLMRYSKTVERPAEAGPPYASTVAIFMSEVFKLPCCLVMAAWSTRHHGGLLPLLRDEMIGKWWTTCKTGVPAFAYTIQGNLLFVALANLEAPTYQVTYQCKTLFTALFSWLLLNRRLQPSQWLALLLLVVGTVLASDTTRAAGGHGRHGGGGHGSGHGSHGGHGSLVVGLGAVLSAALLSASSSVYFEKMLKTPLEGAAVRATARPEPPRFSDLTDQTSDARACRCPRFSRPAEPRPASHPCHLGSRRWPVFGCATCSSAASRCHSLPWRCSSATAPPYASTACCTASTAAWCGRSCCSTASAGCWWRRR